MKNSFVITIVTFKEIIRQPIFTVVILSSILVLLLSSFFTMFAFGDETRLIKDMGATTITLSGLIIAVFYTSNSFASDVKKSTVSTILSKAVSKTSFVCGKFFGTSFAIFLVTLILVLVFGFILSYYNHIDHEHHQHWYSYFNDILLSYDNHLLFGVYFAFLQVLILGSISLLLSVNLSAVSNISICFTIYIFGHLSDYFFQHFCNTNGMLKYIPKFMLTLIPNLQIFDINSLTITDFSGKTLFIFFITTTFYTIFYCLAMITFTILSFHKKDLF